MAHGRFAWNELLTKDAEAAKAFFHDTLGWEYEAFPMPDFTYWVVKAGGEAAGGIMPVAPGSPQAAMAERWHSYVEVDNVDERAKQVESAGGRVLQEPFDVPKVGRICIVADPSGATLGWMTPADRED